MNSYIRNNNFYKINKNQNKYLKVQQIQKRI